MNKFFSFLLVGLAFMALQVSTVAANPCMKANLEGDAMTACLEKERNKSPGEGKMLDHSGMGDMAPIDDAATKGNAAQGFSGEQDVNLGSTVGGHNDASHWTSKDGQDGPEERHIANGPSEMR
jgi:hypothetical protein